MKLFNTYAHSVLGYLPSFGPAPPDLPLHEARALHRLLHLPYNAVTLATMWGWHADGAPRILSASSVARAVAARSAVESLDFLRMLRGGLITAAEEGDLVAWARGQFSPSFWPHESCVEYLMRHAESAAERLAAGAHPPPMPRSTTARRERLAAEAARVHLTGMSAMERSRRLQAKVAEAVRSAVWPYDGHRLICSRVWAYTGTEVFLADVEKAVAVMKRKVGAPTTRFQIWRSWCAGWATHRRLHLDTQSYCFFGCNHSEDSFEHYIVCPRMWFVIQQCTAAPRPLQTPLERLGLAPGMDDDARLHALKQLSVATALYNSMRGEPSLRREVSRAKVTRDLARLWRVLTPVATDQAFSHGGRELARRAAVP